MLGRRQNGGGATPKKLRAVCSLLVGEPIQPLDELVIELHEDFSSSHSHMVRHMGAGEPLGASDVASGSIGCMPRTTLDLDASVLRALKERRRREGKTLGQVASELLARALAHDGDGDGGEPPPLEWTSRPLGLEIDLEDKDALWKVLDGR